MGTLITISAHTPVQMVCTVLLPEDLVSVICCFVHNVVHCEFLLNSILVAVTVMDLAICASDNA